jgi:membrane protein DedA with SNARE-associated domain
LFPSVTLLGHVFDLSGFAKITSLLILPFAHEDLAIVLGGYIIVNNIMPATVVVASIYGGMVASDFALYGIGAAARYLPWLSRYAVDDRVVRFGETLKRNVFGLVALCRVVPGVVFVAFIACGWARVSLARFTAASLIVSAIYLPLILYLVIVFGETLEDRLGFWAWPMLFAAIAGSAYLRKRVFAFQAPAAAATSEAPATATPERSPFTSAAKTGTPALVKPSAMICRVIVLPVPVAPVTRPWRLAMAR